MFYYIRVADREVDRRVCVALQVEGQIQKKANVLSVPAPGARSPVAQPASPGYIANHGLCPEEAVSSSY